MKRKYYMRGLGIGVIVTAILFTVAFPRNKQAMTEEEIIAKAKELGYVKKTEGVTPEDIDKIKEESITPGTTPEGTKVPESTPEPTPTPIPTPDAPVPPEQPDAPETPTQGVVQDIPTKAPTQAPTKKPTATAAPTSEPVVTTVPTAAPEGPSSSDSYTVKIERGMTATKVSRLLESVGAVDSASGFVSYLRKNGLADDINIGTFSIPAGASYEKIAKILTEIK